MLVSPLAGMRSIVSSSCCGEMRWPRWPSTGQVRRGRHRVRHAGDLGTQVHRDDVGAFFGQPDRVAAALSAGGAGDESDLALYSPWHIHCSFTVRYFVVLVVGAAGSAGARHR
jgi:hypothetical protein